MKIKISQDFREADLTLPKKGDRHSQPYHAEPSISIHALRAEGDKWEQIIDCNFDEFQATPSGWRATKEGGSVAEKEVVQSTPSVWRATWS